MTPLVKKNYYWRIGKGKGTAVPVQAWTGSWGFKRLRIPEFLDILHMLQCCQSYVPTPMSLLQPESIPEGISRWRIPVTPIWNWTRDFQASSELPQTSASPRTTKDHLIKRPLIWQLTYLITQLAIKMPVKSFTNLRSVILFSFLCIVLYPCNI